MNVVALIEKEGWLAEDLGRAALELGIGLTSVRWEELAANLGKCGESVMAGNAALRDADALLLRTMRMPSFEQVFFRMDVLHRLEAMGTMIVNSPAAVEISVDKYRSLAMVREAGVATPDTFVCQRYEDAIRAFDALGGDVVMKPLFGSQGFGVVRISDRVMAQRAFAQLQRMAQVAYLQAFVAGSGKEFRLFLLGDTLLAAVEKCTDQWPRNATRGTRITPAEVDDAVVEPARVAARACGAQIAGVDVVVAEGGPPYVLEVNAMPGWKALSHACDLDVTKCVLQFLADAKVRCPLEK